MLSELTKKGILAIKSLLDECRAGIEQTNKDLEVIDEKYRKIIAEEKKTLKGNLAEYKAQLKQYEKMFGTFDEAAVKEVLGEFQSTPSVEEPEQVVESVSTEDKIVDALFPENNEPEDETEEEPVKEEEKKDKLFPDNLDDEEDADLNEKIESGELKEVEPEVKSEDENWEEETEAKAQEEEIPEMNDAGWEDFDNWK